MLLIFALQGPTDLRSEITAEVIKNHLKDMPSEVLTDDYKLMTAALDRLDFNIVESKKLSEGFITIGARYCSILKDVAAQIKLKNIDNGKIYTLYQYKPSDKELLNRIQRSTQKIEKLSIEIWKERDLVFVLAG